MRNALWQHVICRRHNASFAYDIRRQTSPLRKRHVVICRQPKKCLRMSLVSSRDGTIPMITHSKSSVGSQFLCFLLFCTQPAKMSAADIPSTPVHAHGLCLQGTFVAVGPSLPIGLFFKNSVNGSHCQVGQVHLFKCD